MSGRCKQSRIFPGRGRWRKRGNVEINRARPGLGLHMEQLSKGFTRRAKRNARERFLFELAGIALVARMEAFAGITGSGAG